MSKEKLITELENIESLMNNNQEDDGKVALSILIRELLKEEPTGDDVAKALGHMDKNGEFITKPERRAYGPLASNDRRKGDRREKNPTADPAVEISGY